MANTTLKKNLCAFRRQKNLKDMLVSAKLTYQQVEEEKAVFPPQKHYLHNYKLQVVHGYGKEDKGDVNTSSFHEKSWEKWFGFCTPCPTDNVVYLIICLVCRSQYIGETKHKLRQRMYEHI